MREKIVALTTTNRQGFAFSNPQTKKTPNVSGSVKDPVRIALNECLPTCSKKARPLLTNCFD
jgi:hypothetical protein